MNKFFRQTLFFKIMLAAAGLTLAVLVAWMAVAGPVTVIRILRYGDTNIDDYNHYPGRVLDPSPSPVQFKMADAELSLSARLLDAFGNEGVLERILEENDTIAFLIIHGNTVRYQRYFQGHTPDSISQTFSMSKSITSGLIGMAIDDGYLEGPSQPVTDFIPELSDKGFDDVTLHQLLTMTSGSAYQENDNPFGEHVILNYTPRLEERILDFKVEKPPGEVFRYKSGDNALLGLALDRALGEETITAYAQRRMWSPLGMEDRGVWTIDHEGEGLEKTWCCLAASPRDLAKFGRLYLNRGSWGGKVIVSADWVERSIAPQIPERIWSDHFTDIGWENYGYQWWLASEEEGDYFALGKDGQFLYLHPGADLIIVRLGWSTGELPSSRWIAMFQAIASEVR